MGKRKSKRNKSQWVLEESRLELFYSLITIQIAAAAQAAQITIQIALPSSSPRAPLELSSSSPRALLELPSSSLIIIIIIIIIIRTTCGVGSRQKL